MAVHLPSIDFFTPFSYDERMRTFLLAISGLLAVVACAKPAPELVRVSETEPAEVRFVTYADRATINRSGNTVRMSSVIDPEVADDAASRKRRFSWKDEWEYECHDKMISPYRFTEYSGRMGTGEKLYSQRATFISWVRVPHGSVAEKLWQIACGKE